MVDSLNYGIKVMAEGSGITETDIRKILMSSKYSMLKYHSDSEGSFDLVPGDTHKYLDISHDLGYTPAYISFYKFGGKIYNVNVQGANGPGVNIYFYSWSNNTVIRSGMVFQGITYGQTTYDQTPPTGYCWWNDYFNDAGYIYVGKTEGLAHSGALRFTNIPIPQGATIVSATLKFYFEYKGGTGDLRIRTKGINEDNTNDFHSDPMGRARTSQQTDNAGNITNTRFDINVGSIVSAIVNRAGWVSGNAIGFVLLDNGSDDGVYAEDDADGVKDAELIITANTESGQTINFRVIIFKDKIA